MCRSADILRSCFELIFYHNFEKVKIIGDEVSNFSHRCHKYANMLYGKQMMDGVSLENHMTVITFARLSGSDNNR